MSKKELMKLADSFQKKADTAFQNYQETGASRYDSAFRRNEDIAAALRAAAEAADEHNAYIMTGAQSLLCEMLSCGSADLEILDRIGYGWDEILDQMDWPREGLDFNDVLRAAVSVGIINIKEAISERTFLLEATQGIHEKLEPEEAEELEALRDLHPDDDIEGDFNFLATHVWFKSNGPAYRRYLPEAVDNFEDNVGFFLTGGEGDD